jgi:hypothetical protein
LDLCRRNTLQNSHPCFLICVILILSSIACAQPDSLWSRTVLGNGNTVISNAVQLEDGGFVIVGYSFGEATNSDFFAARLSDDGDIVWANNYAESVAAEELSGVAVVNDTIFAVGYGQVGNATSGSYKICMLGLDLNGDSLWYRSYESGGATKARNVISLSDGNLGVIGYKLGASNRSDAWLLKCNPRGDSLWTRIYGTDWTEIGQNLRELPNGDLQLLCNRRSGYSEPYDLWLIHTNANGASISEETFGTVGVEELGYAIVIEDDGSIFLAGRQGALSEGSGYVARIPAQGEPWTQAYLEDGAIEEFQGILLRESSILCVGLAGQSAGQTRPLMVGIDDEGTQLWSWLIGNPGSGSRFYGIAPVYGDNPLQVGGLAFGSYLSGGTLYGYTLRIAPPSGVCGVVTDRGSGEPVSGVKVSAVGQSRYALTNNDGAFNLELMPGIYDLRTHGYCFDPDTITGIFITEDTVATADLTVGAPEIDNLPSSINFIARNHIQSTGIFSLTNTGSGAMSFAFDCQTVSPLGQWLSASPASGTVPPGDTLEVDIIAYPDTTDDGVYEFFGRLRLHTNSCPDTVATIPVLISVLDADQPLTASVTAFALHPAFPNPFNAVTQLRFDLPSPGQVRIDLFDVTGRFVRALVDDKLAAGSHTIEADLTGAASGVYLVRLQSGSFTASRKIVLIK